MGTPAFAVPSLKALIEAGHNVLAVVTQPDKPQGRGMASLPSPVKKTALEHNIQVFEPLKLRDESFIGTLKGLNPDFIAVVAYGKILPQAILDIPPKGCVNLHASLLPGYRGAAPINRAIINGEKETGVSTMLMDRGMDTGPVLLEERVAIGPEETADDLAKRLSATGAQLLAKTIALLAEGGIKPIPQDEKGATYAAILKKEDGRINWAKSAEEVKNLIRGVYPWPGAFTLWKGKILKVHNGAVLPGSPGAPYGTIVSVKDGIGVACGSGVFKITELQPENKKRMSSEDFIKGYRIAEGDRFDV